MESLPQTNEATLTTLVDMEHHNGSMKEPLIVTLNCTDVEECTPGTILGHVIASVSWYGIGILYATLAMRHYYVCKRSGAKFEAAVEFPLDFLPGWFKHFPCVAFVKLVGAGTFLITALVANIEPGTEEAMGQVQHDLMSAMFVVSASVDALTAWSRRNGRTMWLPDGTDYAVFTVTFFIEAHQLTAHLHGRDAADVRMHTLMAATALAAGVALMFEAGSRQHVFMPVIRGYCMMLQGSWVMNLMVFLYYPTTLPSQWTLDSPETVALVSLLFMWHIILNTVVVLLLNLLMAWSMGARSEWKSYAALPDAVDACRCCCLETNAKDSKWNGTLCLDQPKNGSVCGRENSQQERGSCGICAYSHHTFDDDSDLEFEKPVLVKAKQMT